MDIVSEHGYRQDGRKPNELRRLNCRLGVYRQADGSAYLEQGLTKVLVAVYGPHDMKKNRSKANQNKCTVNCQYSMATFSTSDRKLRPRGDRKSYEFTQHLQKTFEAAILVESYPNSQIDIFCEILQADGGNLAACINAASLALVDAGVAVKGIVSASTCGCVGETPVVDVNHNEEASGGSPHLTLAILPRNEEIVTMELHNRLHFDLLEKVMDAGIEACKDVHAVLDAAIQNHASLGAKELGWGD